MVKIRGKKVDFKPSNYVTKELTGAGIGKKRKKVSKNKGAAAEDTNIENKNEVILPETRNSDDPPPKMGRWRNRQRVLIFGSRGIIFRGRHIMDNLRRLMPHAKKESKMDKRDKMIAINEICEMKNCNNCIFLEGRKQGDIYLWISNIPEGPSVKFLMENDYVVDNGHKLLAVTKKLMDKTLFDKLMKGTLCTDTLYQGKMKLKFNPQLLECKNSEL